MALAMTLGATTATSQVLNFAGYAGDSTIEIQYATRPDFNWCVAPRYTIAVAAAHTLDLINHNTAYYVRAREILAGGAEQPWVATLGFLTPQGAARDLSVPAVMIEPATVVVPAPVLEWHAESVTVPGFPVDNLGIDAPVAWRSSDPAAHAVSLRTAGEPVDTFALLMTNAPESATLRVYGGATQGAVTFASGVIPFRASPNLPGRPGFHALLRLPAPQTWRWWMFYLTADCPGGIFHAEHAVVGLNRATKNHSVDKAEVPYDLGTLDRTRSGIPGRARGFRGRRVDFDISMLTEVDYEQNYADLGTRVGLTDPVLVVPNSKAGPFLHDRIIYGPIIGQKAVSPASPIYTRSFTVDSII